MRADLGLLILRVGIGLMMLVGHGWAKLVNFGQIAPNFFDPIGVGNEISLALAVFAEVFCSIFVVVGLFTRFAVVPLIVLTLVAALIVHADDPWSKKEFALLYAVPFITLLFTGAGDFSIDRFFKKR